MAASLSFDQLLAQAALLRSAEQDASRIEIDKLKSTITQQTNDYSNVIHERDTIKREKEAMQVELDKVKLELAGYVARMKHVQMAMNGPVAMPEPGGSGEEREVPQANTPNLTPPIVTPPRVITPIASTSGSRIHKRRIIEISDDETIAPSSSLPTRPVPKTYKAKIRSSTRLAANKSKSTDLEQAIVRAGKPSSQKATAKEDDGDVDEEEDEESGEEGDEALKGGEDVDDDEYMFADDADYETEWEGKKGKAAPVLKKRKKVVKRSGR